MSDGAPAARPKLCDSCCDGVARLFVKHTAKVLLAVVVLMAAASGVILGLDLFAFTEQGNDDFMIKDQPEVKSRDAVRLGEAALSSGGSTSDEAVRALSERSEDFDMFLIVEDRNGDDIAASDSLLRDFQATVRFIIDEPSYSSVCHKPGTDGLCAAPVCPVDMGELPASTLTRFAVNSSATLQPYRTLRLGMTSEERTALFEYYLNPEPEIRNQTETAVRAGVEAQVPPSTPNRQATVDAAVEAQMEAQADTIAEAVAAVKGLRSLFFDSDLSASNKRSKYMRCMFGMGAPLPGFRNAKDREADQDLKFDDAVSHIRETVNKKWFTQSAEERPLRPLVFGSRILQQQFAEVSVTDMVWAAGSVVFVYAYLFFHTGSIFVASLELLQILCSMPLAILVYKLVYGIDFFQTLHSLSVFIILGIGCDAVFIFVDAWNQAPVNVFRTDDETLIKRMRFTYERASKALFVTSFTTFAAFLATGSSQIMPIATFGFFSATLVMMNLLLDLVFLPAVIVLWERSVRPRERACGEACCSAPAVPAAGDDGEEPAEEGGTAKGAAVAPRAARDSQGAPSAEFSGTNPMREEEAGAKPGASGGKPASGSADEAAGKVSAAVSMGAVRAGQSLPDRVATNEDAQATRAIEVCFRDRWTPLVHRLRYVILVLGVALLALTAWASSTLAPLSKQEEWFPTWHFVGRAMELAQDTFGATENDRKVDVTITWGVEGVDREGTYAFDPNDIGTPIWYAEFDPAHLQSQALMHRVCRDIDSGLVPGGKVESLKECWVDSFGSWLTKNGASFPVDISNTTVTGANATASAQLKNACGVETTQSGLFHCLVSEFTTASGSPGVSLRNRAVLGLDSSNKLKLASVVARTSLAFGEPYATNKPVLDAWNAYTASIDETGKSHGMGKSLQNAGMSWAWMQTERALVTNALQGIAIAVSVALVVLVVSTDSIPVGVFATVTIAGIVLSVLATMVALGWELGTTESVSSVILIGYSVDYAVHLANAYQEAGDFHHDGTRKTRLDRTRSALTEYGVSIIAGAVTTFGAGVFLRGGTIMFFQKFSVLIMASIAYSLVWALTFLPAVLMVLAPEDSLCALSAMARCRLRPKLPASAQTPAPGQVAAADGAAASPAQAAASGAAAETAETRGGGSPTGPDAARGEGAGEAAPPKPAVTPGEVTPVQRLDV
ncbi:hypothetical protein FNF31_07845 [Cafeteria roenbergensis]|uniref:SSD domain-containing protein n=1 Tax=Cafeteria roenbergensis TaxID=33653 RepID=A0A5A8BZV7_CAFRO|nr:hypothetical protein FNF31_07845 [Cafeteria roenbergensis]